MTVAFLPIDSSARDGRHHLVRDDRGHQHSARWENGRWVYESGVPVGQPIVDYASNQRGSAGQP
jgi:hypothetical protein